MGKNLLKVEKKIAKKKICKNNVQAKKPGFKCPYCTAVFDKPQGAGGHISKAHPNASTTYRQKMETREARAPQRALLE